MPRFPQDLQLHQDRDDLGIDLDRFYSFKKTVAIQLLAIVAIVSVMTVAIVSSQLPIVSVQMRDIDPSAVQLASASFLTFLNDSTDLI